jgi:membrane associated rhomboid family serine protease
MLQTNYLWRATSVHFTQSFIPNNMSTTVLLIILIVAISLYCWQKPDLQHKLMMNPYYIRNYKEYYRFISSGFIHNGYIHLFFNVLTLYFFGEYMERIFANYFGEIMGKILYVGFFIAGVVVSDIPTYLKHKDHIYYNSLGASGGVSAVVFAYILFNPVALICLYGVICLPGFFLGVLYLAYSYQQARLSQDQINHSAHLFGALFGILVGILIDPAVVPRFFAQVSTWSFF